MSVATMSFMNASLKMSAETGSFALAIMPIAIVSALGAIGVAAVGKGRSAKREQAVDAAARANRGTL